MPNQIHFDISQLRADVAALLESTPPAELVDDGLDDAIAFLHRSGLDVCIASSGPAPVTGDHVIRLGICRAAAFAKAVV